MLQSFYILLLLIPGFLVPGEFGYGDDQVRYQIALGVCSISLWISLQIIKEINVFVAALFLFVACSASIGTFWMISPMTQISHGLATALNTPWFSSLEQTLISDYDITSAQSLVFLFVVSIPVIFCKKEQIKVWLNSFKILIFASVGLCVFNWLRIDKSSTGILGNCSADSMFFAMLIPFILSQKNKWLVVIPLFGMLLCLIKWHSVTGPIMLITMLFAFLWIRQLYAWLLILGSGCGLYSLFYLAHHDFAGFANGRTTVWKEMIEVYISLGNFAFGNGAGSFVPIMVQVQHVHKQQVSFLWGHSEFLQVLFEQGYFGLLMLLIIYVLMLLHSRKTEWLFLTNIGFGISAISQFPFRMFPTALFMAFICKLSFNKKEESICQIQ